MFFWEDNTGKSRYNTKPQITDTLRSYFMSLMLEPLLNRSLTELADILTRAFTDYIMPAQFTPELLAYMTRNDSIDLAASRLLLDDSQPAGIALLARRGERSR